MREEKSMQEICWEGDQMWGWQLCKFSNSSSIKLNMFPQKSFLVQ